VGLAVQSLFGFFALHAAAWALSERRRAIPWRPVLGGMVLIAGSVVGVLY